MAFPRPLVGLLAAASLLAVPAAAQANSSSSLPPYTAADAQFMSGMIQHHAQAILIAGWIPSHGASPALQAMGERIVVGQQDEITIMTRWLRARGQPVPDPAAPMAHAHDHGAMMPGMLTPAQLDSLDQARGPAFDRLFLTYMIQHHLGAIVMVNQLFATPGAAQDETTFRLASDVYADQTTEIGRMEKLQASLAAAPAGP